MRKILIIGAGSVGLGLALLREAERAHADAFAGKIIQAEALAVRERPPVATLADFPPSMALPSHRKGKGEKKRAASARRGKGWA
jgi:hypothetical protein